MQGYWSINRAGGRSLDKGTCTDYNVIMMSEFSLRAVVVLGMEGPKV